MIAELLPTPGDWIALGVWLLIAGTIGGFLLGQELERRRVAKRLTGPIDEHARMRAALRQPAPPKVVVSPERLAEVRQLFPDAEPAGSFGGFPVITTRHLPDPSRPLFLFHDRIPPAGDPIVDDDRSSS